MRNEHEWRTLMYTFSDPNTARKFSIRRYPCFVPFWTKMYTFKCTLQATAVSYLIWNSFSLLIIDILSNFSVSLQISKYTLYINSHRIFKLTGKWSHETRHELHRRYKNLMSSNSKKVIPKLMGGVTGKNWQAYECMYTWISDR